MECVTTHNFIWNAVLHNSDVQGNVVPGGDEVLVGRVVLGLHMPGVRQGEVLLGQLQHQLSLAVLLPGGADAGDLVAREAAHVVVNLRVQRN